MGDAVVLVPYDEGVAALRRVAGLNPVRYDPDGPLPDEAATAQVLVPPFLASTRVVQLIARLPELRLVQLLTAGAEKWIGRLPAHVALSDCRGAHGGATAEWVVAVLLAVYRDLPGFVRSQDERRWDQHFTDELAGKRVLLVGAGDLAENTARRLAPFDVSTTLVGRRPRDGVHGMDEVHDLLPRHDAAVLMVPQTDQTRHLVDARFLAAMPDGSVLVNAARGPVSTPRPWSRSCRPGGCGRRWTSRIPSRCPPIIPSGRHRACCSRRTSVGACPAGCGARSRSWPSNSRRTPADTSRPTWSPTGTRTRVAT